MNKILLLMFSFLLVSEGAFSADNVDYAKSSNESKEQISDFDQRHSLMPVESKFIENNTSLSSNTSSFVKNDVIDNTLSDASIISSMQFPKPEQKLVVKEEVKPVFVVPPAFPKEDKKVIEDIKENLNQPVVDNTTDDDDDEDDYIKNQKKAGEKDNKEVKEENKNLQEEKNEPFVLKQVPEKKYDGTDIIFSNIIEEKADSVENYPLIVNKPKKEEIVKPLVVVEPDPKMNVEPSVVSEPKPQLEEETLIVSKPKQEDKVLKDMLTAHIASYTSEESANKGIKLWTEKYPIISLLKPSIKYENVEGKGMFYRIYLTGDEAKIENLCNQMKSNKDWCNIIR